jgi:hypothetical protein
MCNGLVMLFTTALGAQQPAATAEVTRLQQMEGDALGRLRADAR